MAESAPLAGRKQVDAAPLRFHSILFRSAEEGRELAEAPAYFHDLGLDRIAAAFVAGREEYDLAPFFHARLEEVDAVVYRQEVMRDLEHDALRQVLQRNPALLRTRERLASIPADAAHFKQAEFGQQIAVELERMGSQDGSQILGTLAPLCLAYEEGRHLSPYHILNTAFLVRRDQRARFDEAVGVLAEQWNEVGTVRYLGPQPPYSFVDLEAGDPAWA